MIPWIHVFSKFTLELLFIEFFFLFLLTCGYTLSWVLRKRKYGVIDGELPSGPVRAYIQDLIRHTEEFSIQLFGASSGIESAQNKRGLFDLKKPASDLNAVKIIELEKKLTDQHAILEKTIQENTQLTQELEALKQKQEERELDQNEKIRLQNIQKDLSEKLKLLETRLAEYSIIEEDLADLKRYQQENSEMKRLLGENHIEFQTRLSSQPESSSPPLTPLSSSPPESNSEVRLTQRPSPVDTDVQVRNVSSTPYSSTMTVESRPEHLETLQEGSAPQRTPASASSETQIIEKEKESTQETRKTDAELLADFEKMLK